MAFEPSAKTATWVFGPDGNQRPMWLFLVLCAAKCYIITASLLLWKVIKNLLKYYVRS